MEVGERGLERGVEVLEVLGKEVVGDEAEEAETEHDGEEHPEGFQEDLED